MAKGYDKHNERKNRVADFGKDLARRAKSKCELCETAHVKLHVYEIPPYEHEPEIERCLLLCDDCIKKIENLDKMKENDLRFVTEAVWSNVPMVKAVAVYILRKIKDKYYWAANLEDEIYLDEETLKLLDTIDLSHR